MWTSEGWGGVTSLTQGFSFTKQAIYHVSHTFQNELEFICALVILEMGSANYLPVLASNPDPPDLSLPRS
jgi:hypothetical protein